MSSKVRKIIEEYKDQNTNELSLNEHNIQNILEIPDLLSFAKITRLTLAHNKITTVPPHISELVNLQQLNLSNNLIEELPISIGSLKNLKILKLCFNRLKVLPIGFGSCTSLEILDFTSNNLDEQSLQNNFSGLKQLRALYFSDNLFETIPEQICLLENLQILSFRDNSLIEIPNEIENLKNLKELYIQSNKLRLLPLSIVKLDIFGNKSVFMMDNNPWINEIIEGLKINLFHLCDVISSENYQKIYATEIHNTLKNQSKSEKTKKTPKKST